MKRRHSFDDRPSKRLKVECSEFKSSKSNISKNGKPPIIQILKINENDNSLCCRVLGFKKKHYYFQLPYYIKINEFIKYSKNYNQIGKLNNKDYEENLDLRKKIDHIESLINVLLISSYGLQ